MPRVVPPTGDDSGLKNAVDDVNLAELALLLKIAASPPSAGRQQRLSNQGKIVMRMTKNLIGAVVGAGLLLGAGVAAQALPFSAVGTVVMNAAPDAQIVKTGVATGVAKHKAKRTVRKHV
jgi:hypothetical protein